MTLEAQRVDTECKGSAMIADLGSGYRPATSLSSVEEFQQAWNELRPLVSDVPGVIYPSRNQGFLDTDGLYGAQTQTAEKNFLPAALAASLPARAADVPIWYARHREALLAVCPPAPPVQPRPPAPETRPQPPVPIESALDPSDVVEIESPVVSPAPGPEPEPFPPVVHVQPPPVRVEAEVALADEPIVEAQIPTPGPIPIEPEVIGPSAPSLMPDTQTVRHESPISLTAPARKGGVGVAAVALVGLGVAGIALYAMSGKKRR